MLILLIFFVNNIDLNVVSETIDICTNLKCDEVGEEVCGLRAEGEGFRLKLFPSECDLLKTGCKSEYNFAYSVISMDYCVQAFKTDLDGEVLEVTTTQRSCIKQDCSFPNDAIPVCGIKNDGNGFRIRIFENKCHLWKYNCDNQLDFSVTNFYICDGMEPAKSSLVTDATVENANFILNNQDSIENLIILNNSTNINGNVTEDSTNEGADTVSNEMRNIVVVRSSLIDFNQINDSIENFFAATHIFDLPVREMDRNILNETTRRRLVKVAGPIRVFVPWVIIPKNISEDFDHTPTLSTCYHKCPRKCPETYAPVCGVPGIVAREPSLMFQNHCFMDVAQCKMFWENKSPTSLSSSYVESSFLFCLGDEMNGMYRFLPLIKTLQHMGRLRKKGRYHYRFHNMKFFNNLLSRQPKFMGK